MKLYHIALNKAQLCHLYLTLREKSSIITKQASKAKTREEIQAQLLLQQLNQGMIDAIEPAVERMAKDTPLLDGLERRPPVRGRKAPTGHR